MHLRRDDIALREVAGEVVLLCLRSSTYFSVNRSGAVLLRALREGPTERPALVQALADEFDADADAVAADVDVFLAELAGAGLLVDV